MEKPVFLGPGGFARVTTSGSLGVPPASLGSLCRVALGSSLAEGGSVSIASAELLQTPGNDRDEEDTARAVSGLCSSSRCAASSSESVVVRLFRAHAIFGKSRQSRSLWV